MKFEIISLSLIENIHTMKNVLFCIILSSFFLSIDAQIVTTIAGPNSGINDGLIMDSVGNIYGSDFGISTTGGSSVYKINTAGVLSTFSTGYSSCNGLALDHQNNLYVVDYTSNANTHQVYKLDAAGVKTPYGPTITGASGIIFDPLSDTMYVSQYSGTSVISKLSPDGNVTLHSNHPLLNGPVGMAFDSSNVLYVANFTDGDIFKVTNNGDSLTLIADIPNPSFGGVGFLTYASGNLYASGIGTHKIYKISTAGVVIDFAGTGSAGSIDGAANVAQFNRPNGITTNYNQDKLYVSDYVTESVREISSLISGIDDVSNNASAIELFENYPNPANIATRIIYDVATSTKIQLALFSMDGQLVKTLVSSTKEKGKHQHILKTSDYKDGIYFCRLTVDGFSKSIKITVAH